MLPFVFVLLTSPCPGGGREGGRTGSLRAEAAGLLQSGPAALPTHSLWGTKGGHRRSQVRGHLLCSKRDRPLPTDQKLKD